MKFLFCSHLVWNISWAVSLFITQNGAVLLEIIEMCIWVKTFVLILPLIHYSQFENEQIRYILYKNIFWSKYIFQCKALDHTMRIKIVWLIKTDTCPGHQLPPLDKH